MTALSWMRALASRLRRPVAPPLRPATESYADALLALGFDTAAYREDHPVLQALSPRELAAHYHLSGRVERFGAMFGVSLGEGQDRIEGMPLDDDARDLLRLDLAAAALRRADAHGRDPEEASALLRRSPSHRPLMVVSDSHGMLYLTEDVVRGGRLLPVPFLCTGASARGLGNPNSRAGAGGRIRAQLLARKNDLAGAAILFKFGQVDLEFVYDYRRIRDGGRRFDEAEAAAFARESARRLVDFVAGLRDLTPATLVVTAALPPALNDEAVRDGYVNAHIVELHAELGPDALREQLQALDMPDWRVRTGLAATYNTALAAACAEAGVAFYDDFTPLVGPQGVIDPDLIVWHGGTDHHLCFTSPAARRATAGFAADIARLTAGGQSALGESGSRFRPENAP